MSPTSTTTETAHQGSTHHGTRTQIREKRRRIRHLLHLCGRYGACIFLPAQHPSRSEREHRSARYRRVFRRNRPFPLTRERANETEDLCHFGIHICFCIYRLCHRLLPVLWKHWRVDRIPQGCRRLALRYLFGADESGLLDAPQLR